ncbi:MAG: flagellar export protein FliJ [Woeseiaceae bacterium]
MKRRTDRMHRVYLLAGIEEKQQCRAMGQSQRSLDQELERLEELKAYRLSYGMEGRQGRFNSMQWKDYQHFLQRLDQAVAIQTQVVLDGKQKRDAHRSRWMSKRRKVESLERVVDRFESEETEQQERTRQKAADELSVNRRPMR